MKDSLIHKVVLFNFSMEEPLSNVSHYVVYCILYYIYYLCNLVLNGTLPQQQQLPYILKFGSVKDTPQSPLSNDQHQLHSPPVGTSERKRNNSASGSFTSLTANNSSTFSNVGRYIRNGAPTNSAYKQNKRESSESGTSQNPKPQKCPRVPALSVIPKYPENAKEIYDKHLSEVTIELHNKELWDDFFQTGTEMILTRNGR